MGDFGCFLQGNSQAKTTVGTLPYMSPQQLEKLRGLVQTYSAFKGDVFSLGMTLYALASLTPPYEPWPIASLEHTAQSKKGTLLCCETFKTLLLNMLSLRESDIPDMQVVLERANTESAIYELAKAVQMKTAGNYQGALELLQRAKTVLVESAEVYLELGRVYSHFGQWAEAEAVLSQGLHLHSNLTLQLSNVLAETHFQQGHYRDCVSTCERSLDGGKGPTFELQRALTTGHGPATSLKENSE